MSINSIVLECKNTDAITGDRCHGMSKSGSLTLISELSELVRTLISRSYFLLVQLFRLILSVSLAALMTLVLLA